MYDENLHNIRIYFTNSHVHVLLYAYNCVIITYNLPGVKVIIKKIDLMQCSSCSVRDETLFYKRRIGQP